MKRLRSYIVFSTLLFMTATVYSAMPEENIPLFESPIAGGIQLTIRLSEYDYIAGEPVLIECWIRNRSVSDQNVCIFPLEFIFFAKIEKDGKSIFDTEDGFVAGGDFAEGIGERKASEKDYYELEPGWSLRVMTDDDLLAVYRYIRSMGPKGDRAPDFRPPGQEPPRPYIELPTPPSQ